MVISPIPTNLAAFLIFDDVVNIHNEIKSKAVEITEDLTDEIKKAKALFEWVRDTIPHSKDACREEVTKTAVEVFETGTGICYAKSHLLASMMRSQNIPCGFCYQVFSNPISKIPKTMALHGLNGIYLSSLKKWIRIDPRGNTAGVRAEFDIKKEQLAFPTLQMLDTHVYARPLDTVVSALTTFQTVSELWPYLPSV